MPLLSTVTLSPPVLTRRYIVRNRIRSFFTSPKYSRNNARTFTPTHAREEEATANIKINARLGNPQIVVGWAGPRALWRHCDVTRRKLFLRLSPGLMRATKETRQPEMRTTVVIDFFQPPQKLRCSRLLNGACHARCSVSLSSAGIKATYTDGLSCYGTLGGGDWGREGGVVLRYRFLLLAFSCKL